MKEPPGGARSPPTGKRARSAPAEDASSENDPGAAAAYREGDSDAEWKDLMKELRANCERDFELIYRIPVASSEHRSAGRGA